MSKVIDKPRIGETVLFDSGGKTYASRITWCDDKGNVRVQPFLPVNGPIEIENLRRPISEEQVLSEEEVLAHKLKRDGNLASLLSKKDPLKYKALMRLITSGDLRKP